MRQKLLNHYKLKKDEHYAEDASQKARINSSLSENDVYSTISVLDSSTQTTLTSDVLSHSLPEVSRTQSEEAPSVYSDAVNSDEEFVRSDEMYVMPDYVAIKFSQRPKILLKDNKKTTTIRIDPKHLENDEVKLCVRDWPIGDFSLSVGGFQIFPKCSPDLPDCVVVSTVNRKFPLNDVTDNDAKHEENVSALQAKEWPFSSASRKSTEEIQLGAKPKTPSSLKSYDSYNLYQRINETDIQLTRSSQKNINQVNIIKINESSHHYNKNIPFHDQKIEKGICEFDRNKTKPLKLNQKEKKSLITNATQTLVHIDPNSISDDKSNLTGNTLMLVPETNQMSGGFISKSKYLETFISKEDTEGQMGSCDVTDQTLKEIPEMPEGSIDSSCSQRSKCVTEEEMSDLLDKEIENIPEVVQNKSVNTEIQRSPENVTDYPLYDHKLIKNTCLFQGWLNKRENVAGNSTFGFSQKTNTNEKPKERFNEPDITMSEVLNNRKPQLGEHILVKEKLIRSIDGSGIYETYTRAKSAILRTIDVLEKEMEPLRNKLNMLQCEFKSLNVTGDSILPPAQIQDTVYYSSQSTENPFNVNSFQIRRGPEELPLEPNNEFHRCSGYSQEFGENIEMCSCLEINSLPQYHAEGLRNQEQDKGGTTDPNIPQSNFGQDNSSSVNHRRTVFIKSSMLSDPDDIL